MLEETPPFLQRVRLCRNEVAKWDTYPFNIPAISHLDILELHPKVTFIVGENGSGKSTLVEAIAMLVGLNREGGTKNFCPSPQENGSRLESSMRLVRGVRRERYAFFLRAETMFNVSTDAEALWPDVRLHEMSHGEAFLWIAMHRFYENGLYILDEPEAALSPQRQLAFLVRLEQLVRGGSQFVISTHSPILMAYPGAWIYQLGERGIAQVDYEDTDHFTVTREVLLNSERVMRDLFEQCH